MLAIILAPFCWLHDSLISFPFFSLILLHSGKLLFSLFDIFCGYLLHLLGAGKEKILFAWLLNPMVLTVSTRGNAESIVCALVLLHVYLMAKVLYSNNHHEKDKNGHWQRDLDMAAVVLGLATHVKLFPVLFGMGFAIRCLRASKYVILVRFMVISAGTFFALTFATWSLFGWQGLNASLLYHLTRQDPRHNFAPHFYPIYLIQSSTVDRTRHIACSSTIATLLKQNWPSLIQFAAVLGVSVLDGVSYPVSCFLQTATFVTFNRVITSQVQQKRCSRTNLFYVLFNISFLVFFVVFVSSSMYPIRALVKYFIDYSLDFGSVYMACPSLSIRIWRQG